MAGLNSAGGGGGSGAIRAGRAFVELFAEDNKVYRALDKLKSRFQKFGGFVAKIGAVTGGVGASVLAGFKPALDALNETARIGDAAEAFGLTAESASRLFGIMAAGGSDVRDATEGLVTLNDRVADAIAGTGKEAADLFDGLNVSATEFESLDSAGRFYKLIASLKAVPDPAKRVQLLLKAVGEDTGKNLIPLLSMTSDEMAQLGDQFQRSAEDMKAARDAARAQKLAIAQLGAVLGQVAGAIAPVVKDVADGVGRVAKPVGEFVKNNRELVATVVTVAAALVAAGVAGAGLGLVVAGLGTVLGLAVGAVKLLAVGLATLFSPIGLVAALAAGVAYLGYVLLTETDAGKEFVAWVKGGLVGALDTAKLAWEGIAAAIQKGDFATAGKIAVKGLEVVWLDFVHTLTLAWTGFKMTFVDGWHDVVTAVKVVWVAFGGWLARQIAKAVSPVLSAASDAASAAGAMDLFNKIEAARGKLNAMGIDAERVGLDDAKDIIEKAGKAAEERAKARVDDVKKAKDAVDRAKGELLAAVEAAKLEVVRGGKGLGLVNALIPAAARAADIAGSRGTFSAIQAGQLGSDSLSLKQLKAAQETAENTEKQVRAFIQFANALRLQ